MRTALIALTAMLCLASAAPGQRLPASSAANSPGRPVILLVHGRGLLGHDTSATRKMWMDALDHGTRSLVKRDPYDDADVRVVWYADALDPRSQAGCDYAAADPRARRDARTDEGVKTLMSIAGGLLTALSSAVSDSESGMEVRGLAADASFLSDARRRCAAEQRLGDAIGRARHEGRPVILVAHSLGAVVAYDYLSSRPDSAVVQRFVTLGSPLGAPGLRNLLIGGDSTDVLAKPAGVKEWVNVRHADDNLAVPVPVARDTVVDRPADEPDPHELVGYLRGKLVAREILNGWCAAFATDRPQGCIGIVSR
jgi:pimeloyl-ACP methyl ester carboxylesterase